MKKEFKPDYKSYNESCDKDEPIKPNIHILEYIGQGKEYGHETPSVDYNDIQIWSGRCESVRKKTEKWLKKNVAHYSPYDFILKMRPIGNYMPDDVLKEMWLDEHLEMINGKRHCRNKGCNHY